MTPIRSAGALVLATVAGATTSCTQVTGQNSAYVIVDPQRSDDFFRFMERLSRDSGLTPHFGESTYSPGIVLEVMEASGWSLTLWLANVPLSGKEDARLCGPQSNPYPDPAQFLFYVEPRFAWNSQGNADEVRRRIVESLKAEGYDVRAEPALCGRYALHTQP
jgi:hypothetical protein